MKKLFFLLACLTSNLLAAEPPKLTLESLQFVAPAGWVDVPSASSMRKGTWRTSENADAAEISFFFFGKDQSGTVSSNIQRWFSQFSDSATKGESATVAINERPVTFARSEGTFSSGMPGGPQGTQAPLPDYALCGAIIELNSGMIFVKMTGPKATVTQLEKAFTELVTQAAKS